MWNVFFCTCKHRLYKPTIASKLPGLKKKKSAFQIQSRNPAMKQEWGGGLPKSIYRNIGRDNYHLAACSQIPLLGRNMYATLRDWRESLKMVDYLNLWFNLSSNLNAFFFLVCVCVCVCAHGQSCLCLTLYDPMDYNPPGSSVHGIFQPRILEWVAISFSRGSSWPRDRTRVSCIGMQILYHLGSSFPWPIFKNNQCKMFLEFKLLTHSFVYAVIFHRNFHRGHLLSTCQFQALY